MLPLRTAWRPVLVVNNEFFLVPWDNPYANGGTYTQNRLQIGVRLPITSSLAVRPYYLVQSVNLPDGWDTNEILGISLGYSVSARPIELIAGLSPKRNRHTRQPSTFSRLTNRRDFCRNRGRSHLHDRAEASRLVAASCYPS